MGVLWAKGMRQRHLECRWQQQRMGRTSSFMAPSFSSFAFTAGPNPSIDLEDLRLCWAPFAALLEELSGVIGEPVPLALLPSALV